jgi:superfamily II DNA or RNA helicase
MAAKALRPYQQEAVERVKGGIAQGKRAGVVHFFTGGGKSITAIEINRQLAPPDKARSWMIAPARSLIWQMYENYKYEWPELRGNVAVKNYQQLVPGIGVVMERHNTPAARIIVASAQTLVDRTIADKTAAPFALPEKSELRLERDGSIRLASQTSRKIFVSERVDQILAQGGLPSLIQFDECHHSVSDASLVLMQRLRHVARLFDLEFPALVGYTATPMRYDGRGLNNLFETIYITRSYRWAQQEGYLVPFATPVRVIIDDGTGDTLKLEDTRNWLPLIVKAAKEKASQRHIMGFTGKAGETGGVEASILITEAFNAAGIPAAHTDGEKCVDVDGSVKPVSARGDIYRRYMKGEIQALWSYGVGLEGLDLPVADCLFWLRSTDNDVLKTQAVGRVLRLHPGKTDALIVEFTGRAFSISPIGSLFGYQVNTDNQYVPEEEENEEDLLLDSTESKKRTKKSPKNDGEKLHYTVAEIINKQATDWYRDENDDIYSVAVSSQQSLVIVAPNYVVGQACQTAAEAISDVLNTDNAAALAAYPYLQQQPTAKLREWEEALLYLAALHQQYTLWSVINQDKNWKLEKPVDLLRNSSIDDLLLDATDYMARLADQEQLVSSFTRKKASWKRQAVTEAQLKMLRSLGYENRDSLLKMGEASSIINHLLVTPPVKKQLALLKTKLTQAGILGEHS